MPVPLEPCLPKQLWTDIRLSSSIASTASKRIARALGRTREVGIRIATGARPAAYLCLLLNQYVGGYFPPELQLAGLRPQPLDWLLFLAFGLGVGLLAGWLPARQLAQAHPSRAIQGNSAATTPRAAVFSLARQLMLWGRCFGLTTRPLPSSGEWSKISTTASLRTGLSLLLCLLKAPAAPFSLQLYSCSSITKHLPKKSYLCAL
jgi:hypothetical protein